MGFVVNRQISDEFLISNKLIDYKEILKEKGHHFKNLLRKEGL